jgi:hypothetical protein
MRHFLIVDIETRMGNNPEISLAPFAEKLKGRGKDANPISDARIQREELAKIIASKALLSPVTARLLSIGVMEVTMNDEINPELFNEPVWHFICDEDESKMLDEFNHLIQPTTEFVTFNGRGFDFRFLSFRYAIHNKFCNGSLSTYPYNGKDGHHDLMVMLNEMSNLEMLNSQFKYISLGRWIEFFGINVVKKSIKSGQINLEQLLAEGKLDEIEKYNRGDCQATLEIFQRFVGVCPRPWRSRYTSGGTY